jgi:UDP-glucose 4-epimerase
VGEDLARENSGLDLFQLTREPCAIPVSPTKVVKVCTYISLSLSIHQMASFSSKPKRRPHLSTQREFIAAMDGVSVVEEISPKISPVISPSLSSSSLSSPSVQTPDTQISVLFDQDVADDPLDIADDDRRYILVVGGCGYIGSHTTLELLKEGYNVIVVDDLSNAFRTVLDRVKFLAAEFCKERGQSTPDLKFFEMDYRSPSMRTVLTNFSYTPGSAIMSRISGVIHFAAFKSVEESIRNPLPYYANNVCGLVGFLGLLAEFGIKNFVFSSSATVYGSMANSGIPLKEGHCVHFHETRLDENGVENTVLPGVLGLTSPYGRTKFMCEQILADLARSDPSWKITALRYFNPVRDTLASSACKEKKILMRMRRSAATNLACSAKTLDKSLRISFRLSQQF